MKTRDRASLRRNATQSASYVSAATAAVSTKEGRRYWDLSSLRMRQSLRTRRLAGFVGMLDMYKNSCCHRCVLGLTDGLESGGRV